MYFILLVVIILSVSIPLIFGLVKNKGKTQYKLTANICCVMFALILSFAVQFLLGASLSNKNPDNAAIDTNQYSLLVYEEYEEEIVDIDDSWSEESTSYSALNLSVNNIICGLAGYAVFVVVVLATYKLQHRLELNKIINNNQSTI